ncbi:hypothetical protein [Natrialba asiatica]|uniref:Uncharacterized protein n=1 Tax=Natrialba asiatica (strain ATCC 700177 / DSM 12278 / JCM 9576 / FERM P-10747 / NBRC 102637 / 172P1) TaxID=29540 RepID=M0AW75_NATA1|nr:hypothetical protein [Natrialba asiatica]ELZ02557.1 hypothetical protein C481_07816 [Natrialba asiatica DSM 12278]
MGLVLVGFVFLLALPLAGLCLSYAVSADAAARGADGGAWGLATFFTLSIAALAYLIYRRRLPDRSDPATRRERLIGTAGIGIGTAYTVGSIIAPPDPFSMLLFVPPLLVVTLPAAYGLCYEPGWRAIVS